jgi:hypothetical protein
VYVYALKEGVSVSALSDSKADAPRKNIDHQSVIRKRGEREQVKREEGDAGAFFFKS